MTPNEELMDFLEWLSWKLDVLNDAAKRGEATLYKHYDDEGLIIEYGGTLHPIPLFELFKKEETSATIKSNKG